jgi:hypothetical protein
MSNACSQVPVLCDTGLSISQSRVQERELVYSRAVKLVVQTPAATPAQGAQQPYRQALVAEHVLMSIRHIQAHLQPDQGHGHRGGKHATSTRLDWAIAECMRLHMHAFSARCC